MTIKYFDDETKKSMLTIVETRNLYSIYKRETKSFKISFEEFCRMLKVLYMSKKSEIESSDVNIYDFFENMFNSYKNTCVEIIEKDEGFEGEVCVPIKLTIKFPCKTDSKFLLIDSLFDNLRVPNDWLLNSVRSAMLDNKYEIDDEHVYFMEKEKR